MEKTLDRLTKRYKKGIDEKAFRKILATKWTEVYKAFADSFEALTMDVYRKEISELEKNLNLPGTKKETRDLIMRFYPFNEKGLVNRLESPLLIETAVKPRPLGLGI